MIDYTEEAIFAEKGYGNQFRRKKLQRKNRFDGILSKGYRNKPLSQSEIKLNKLLSTIRDKVEGPFAYVKGILNYRLYSYYNVKRNRFEFIMAAFVYNIRKLITAVT